MKFDQLIEFANAGLLGTLDSIKRNLGWIWEQPWYGVMNTWMNEKDALHNRVGARLNHRNIEAPQQTIVHSVSDLYLNEESWAHPFDTASGTAILSTIVEPVDICRGYNHTLKQEVVFAIDRDDPSQFVEYYLDHGTNQVTEINRTLTPPVAGLAAGAIACDSDYLYVIYRVTASGDTVIARYAINPWTLVVDWYRTESESIDGNLQVNRLIIANDLYIAYPITEFVTVGVVAVVAKDGSSYTVGSGSDPGDDGTYHHIVSTSPQLRLVSDGTNLYTDIGNSGGYSRLISAQIINPALGGPAGWYQLDVASNVGSMAFDGSRVIIVFDDSGNITPWYIYPTALSTFAYESPYTIPNIFRVFQIEFDGSRLWFLGSEDGSAENNEQGFVLPLDAAALHGDITATTILPQWKKLFLNPYSLDSSALYANGRLIYSDEALWIQSRILRSPGVADPLIRRIPCAARRG